LIDALAVEILKDSPDQKPHYGVNALFITCVWDIFNVRYRAWERFVKYTRLLSASKSDVAAGIVQRAAEGRIIVPDNLTDDIGKAWEVALSTSSVEKLTSRKDGIVTYTLGDPSAAMAANEFGMPEQLCGQCSGEFNAAVHRVGDTIEAIPGIPSSVIDSAPVTLAAALRRGALWAATSPECCESCASRIGVWANDMSDKVVVALCLDELEVCSRDWLLQNYVMGCVAFSPLRLIYILAGFDLNVDIEYQPGAMGDRDVVDC
jgi:hypothetical protein